MGRRGRDLFFIALKTEISNAWNENRYFGTAILIYDDVDSLVIGPIKLEGRNGLIQLL